MADHRKRKNRPRKRAGRTWHHDRDGAALCGATTPNEARGLRLTPEADEVTCGACLLIVERR